MTNSPHQPREPFWLKLAISAGGAGLMPRAPGTFGSLVGVLLAYILLPFDTSIKIAVLVVLSAISLVLIHFWEKISHQHDDSRIVLDEVCGQLLAFVLSERFCGLSLLSSRHLWLWFVLCFGFFRAFDIVKRGPVGWVDRMVPGTWGTFFDDIVAGVFAAVVVVVLTHVLLFTLAGTL